MVCKILGIKSLEGTSKKTGKPFDSYILHTVRQNPADQELKGAEVKQIFVDKKFLIDDVKRLGGYSALVGNDVSISYDDGGYVESADIIDIPHK